MNMKKRVDVIIFDLDGTLIDSKLDIIKSVNYTLKEVGLKEEDPAFIKNLIGWGTSKLIEDALGRHKDKFDKALLIFNKYYKAHQLDTTNLYPNVKDVLEYFLNKPKAIASNKSKEFVRDTLVQLGIRNYFVKIIGGDDISCLKPSTCQIDKILHSLKIPSDKAILVGDMSIDIKTAKSANILSCGVTYGLGNKIDLENLKPDFIIDNIIDLKKIIE